MGSTRLPGKVLADLQGKPAIDRLVSRLTRSESIDDIVLATSVSPLDDVLANWAGLNGISVFRGSEDDVLGRVVAAHEMMGTQIAVEITGDCVLLDPVIVDLAVETFLGNVCDIVTNSAVRAYPLGMDLDVFDYSALASIEAAHDDPAVREHVCLYFYEHPDEFRMINIYPPPSWSGADIRLVLDYPEDLELINEVWKRLTISYGEAFGVGEIVELFKSCPELLEINHGCLQKSPR